MRLKPFLAASALLTVFSACEKESNNPNPAPAEWEAAGFSRQLIQVSSAYSVAAEEIYLAAMQVDVLAGRPDKSTTAPQSCAGRSVEHLNGDAFPKALRLNFSGDCRDNTGKLLSGSLRATFSAALNQRGARVSIETSDFTYDNLALSGSLSFEVQTVNAQGPTNIRQDLVAAQLVLNSRDSITYDETVFSLLSEGANTSFEAEGLNGLLDDIWTANRTATLVDQQDNTSALTSSPVLHCLTRCTLPMEGGYTVRSASLEADLVIEFGSGDCDNNYRWTFREESGSGTF